MDGASGDEGLLEYGTWDLSSLKIKKRTTARMKINILQIIMYLNIQDPCHSEYDCMYNVDVKQVIKFTMNINENEVLHQDSK